MIIELDDIFKKFGKLIVVNHVSLLINDGEFFTLLGPSGCGKTTLLRMIAGFHDPDSGDVRFDGKSVISMPAHKRDTGMVFQNYALFPHMTVFDNVAYGLQARKVPSSEIRKRVLEMLEIVKLDNMADRYPRQLSGGQQQRVALARALVIRPQVLLMDEPLSNLDAKLRVSMREEIRRIQKSLGITTVYVTHDQEEAMAVSDRIAVFYDGHMQQADAPRDIYFRPVNRFTADFMGSCNIIPMKAEGIPDAEGTIRARSEDGTVFYIKDSAQRAEEGKDVFVMLRPDWIRPAEDSDRNRFAARITESMFLGSSTVFRLEALGQTLRVDAPVMSSMDFKKPGDTVELAFAPERAVIVEP